MLEGRRGVAWLGLGLGLGLGLNLSLGLGLGLGLASVAVVVGGRREHGPTLVGRAVSYVTLGWVRVSVRVRVRDTDRVRVRVRVRDRGRGRVRVGLGLGPGLGPNHGRCVDGRVGAGHAVAAIRRGAVKVRVRIRVSQP